MKEALLIGFFGFLGFQLLTGLIAGLILSQLSVSDSITESNVFIFGFYAVSSLIAFAPIGLFLRQRQLGLRSLGLDQPSLKKLWLSLPAFVVYFLAASLIYVVVKIAVPTINLSQPQELGFMVTEQLPQLILIFLSLVCIAPLVEELVFRGFIFRGLRSQLAFWPAALLDGIVFGLAHWQLNVVLDTAVLGIVSCWLYERTGSIWPSVMLHGLKNLAAFALKFVFSV